MQLKTQKPQQQEQQPTTKKQPPVPTTVSPVNDNAPEPPPSTGNHDQENVNSIANSTAATDVNGNHQRPEEDEKDDGIDELSLNEKESDDDDHVNQSQVMTKQTFFKVSPNGNSNQELNKEFILYVLIYLENKLETTHDNKHSPLYLKSKKRIRRIFPPRRDSSPG